MNGNTLKKQFSKKTKPNRLNIDLGDCKSHFGRTIWLLGWLLFAACATISDPPTIEPTVLSSTIIPPSTQATAQTKPATQEVAAISSTTTIEPLPKETIEAELASASPTSTLILQEGEDSAENTQYLPVVQQIEPTATPLPTPTKIVAAVVAPTAIPVTPEPTATPVPPCIDSTGPPPEIAPPYLGLHASADPHISNLERCTFLELRPSVIKILTFHPPPDIALLAQSQPDAHWIVRAFLEFGGRNISADDFVRFTLSDTERTLALLSGRPVVVELHNEPNLVAEGYQSTWQSGTEFAAWWLEILAQYRTALPNTQFIYPGLSPGNDINGVRSGHLDFLEQSRAAVDAADGLGLHLYWGRAGSMQDALATLDEVIALFPDKPIWITEASYNAGGISDEQRSAEYLAFVEALKSRPTVQGVTFFVASASNPDFEPETWVGKNIAKTLGTR